MVAAPDWLADALNIDELAHRYGERVDGWTMPSSATTQDRLAVVFGQDALAVGRAVAAPGAPGWLVEIPTVAFRCSASSRHGPMCTWDAHSDGWSGSASRRARTTACRAPATSGSDPLSRWWMSWLTVVASVSLIGHSVPRTWR